jgi:hypothetical protein
MKISPDRLANHRIHIVETAVKDLSVEELRLLAQVIERKKGRTIRAKLDLVEKEIQRRQSPLSTVFFSGT